MDEDIDPEEDGEEMPEEIEKMMEMGDDSDAGEELEGGFSY